MCRYHGCFRLIGMCYDSFLQKPVPPQSPVLFRYHLIRRYYHIDEREAGALGYCSLSRWCEDHFSKQRSSIHCQFCCHSLGPVNFCTCVFKSPYGVCRELRHSPDSRQVIHYILPPQRHVIQFGCGCTLSYSQYVPKVFSR